tara:strand:- start:1135 stop:2343 length:1209 start_codon:yes stop_codon:yes gene_type:complete
MKFFNLGVFSRVLLVIVKPLALWLSIQLDTDSGLAIAQIYLIGLLFISLSGTNAHRPFYQKFFGAKDDFSNINVIRSFIEYIQKITLQLILVILASLIIATIVFWGSLGVVIMGILFGIAEKINDEFQRYSQFINNSNNLFLLALSKLIPVSIASLLSYLHIIDIRFSFPALLLVGSIVVVFVTYFLTFRIIVNKLRKSILANFKMSFEYIRQDILQIGCVFMGISLISLDKWLLQYFLTTDLPTYMLYTQIASIFIVSQTIILIAPVRARLVNENPQDINTIRVGSPIISIVPFLIGILLYFNDDVFEGAGQLGYFAFFFASIVTFSVAYVERLYWATTAKKRLILDSSIVISFLLSVVMLTIFSPKDYLVLLSLLMLFCFMCLRVIVMIYLLNKNKSYSI